MTTLIISQTGQLTLHHDLLTHLGIKAGKIDVEKLPNGELRLRAAPDVSPHDNIELLIGRYKGKVKQPISLEEMNDTIEQGWAKS